MSKYEIYEKPEISSIAPAIIFTVCTLGLIFVLGFGGFRSSEEVKRLEEENKKLRYERMEAVADAQELRAKLNMQVSRQ